MQPAAVITGAASGIGRELARCAARRDGAIVVLVDRSQDGLTEVATEPARPAHSPYGAARSCRAKMPATGWNARSPSVVLFATFWSIPPALASSDRGATDRQLQLELLDVNVRALTELTLRFVPGMVAREAAAAFLMSAPSPACARPNMAAYHASKAYVRSFSAALAVEFEGTGVSVTCLAPGIVVSPFFSPHRPNKTRLARLMPRSTAREVATAGWRALQKGQTAVTPGLWNQLIIAACRLAPHALLLRLIATLQQPN